jgi:hypothetical protein
LRRSTDHADARVDPRALAFAVDDGAGDGVFLDHELAYR